MIYRTSQRLAFQMMLGVYDSSMQQALSDIGHENLYERDVLKDFWESFLEYAAPQIAIQNKLRFIQKDLKNLLSEADWDRFSVKYEYYLKKNLKQLLKWYFWVIKILLKIFGIGVDDLIDIGLNLILDD